jgi:hypothetical protein
MPNYPAPPPSGLAARWACAADGSDTSVVVRWENEGWTAELDLVAARCQLVLRLSATWMVTQAMLFRDLDEPDLWLGTDGHGRWGEVNGSHRTDLDGCVDVDVAGSPFTNCIPIRRVPLAVGHGFRGPALVIDTETLAVVPREQTYSRVGPDRWRYTSLDTDTEVEVEVDAAGLVIDEPGAFRRIGGDQSTID